MLSVDQFFNTKPDYKLFHTIFHWNSKRFGNALPIGRISLHAVANMADFNLFRSIPHSTGGILKKQLLLFRIHQAEQVTGLGVIVIIVLTMVPMIGSAVKLSGGSEKSGCSCHSP